MAEQQEPVNKKQKSRRSKIWTHFTDNVDDEVAECNYCGKAFSQKVDKNGRNPGTNSMKYHLEKEHSTSDEVKGTLKEMSESKKAAPTTNRQNIQLIMRAQGAKPMPQDCPESIRIHRSIMEMLAFHYRPFSFVEDACFLMTLSLLNVSFQIYGADHFRTVILNDVYNWAVFTIMAEIKCQASLHFTSDLWKCKLSGFQYISLTIHWCDVKSFKMRHFCLGTIRVEGRAVNENVFILWVNLWLKWDILTLKDNAEELQLCMNKGKPRSEFVTYRKESLSGWKRIKSVVCDGGSNLAKARKRFPPLLEQFSLGCLNHLVDNITDSACSEILSVDNAVTNCKECVEYVKRSPPIQEKLYAIQTDLGLPHLKLQQHTPIRWDSKFTMMNRCQTLKPALLELYTDSEYMGTTITGSDWQVIPKALIVLKGPKVFNKCLQSEREVCSRGVFLMQALKIAVESAPVTGLNNLKTKLIRKLTVGLQEHLDEYSSVVACYLNINFKSTILDPELLENLKKYLLEDMIDVASTLPQYRNLGAPTRPTQAVQPSTQEFQQSQVASIFSSIRARIPNATQPSQ